MPTKAQLAARNLELERQLAQLQEDHQEENLEVFEDLEDQTLQDVSQGDDLEMFLREAGASKPEGDKVVDGYWYDDEGDGDVRFVHRWPLDKFSLPEVLERFGGGRWSFRLRFRSGGYIASRTVKIDGPRKDPKAPADKEDPRTFSDQILDSQGLILEKMNELRMGPPAGGSNVDPINMALSIVGAFQSVIAPMQEKLLAKEQSEPNFGELVTIFQQGIEMGKLSTPPNSDPMGQVLATTLPTLMQAIGAGTKQPNSNPLEVLTNPPNEAPSLAPGADPVGTPTARPGWDVLLGNYLPFLLKWARKDSDFSLRAEFVVDELPPEAEAIVLDQLRRGPEFFTEFMVLHPEAKPWEEWFANFWIAIADQYPWGEGDMGPHPFRTTEEAADGEAAEIPATTEGVEVGTH